MAGYSTPVVRASVLGDEGWRPKWGGGLAWWMAADKVAGVADGAAFAPWPDMSGRNANAAQTTGANQPTLVYNQQNGLPVVRFSGTPQEMTLTKAAHGDILVGSPTKALFIAAKWGSSTANQRLIQYANAGGSSRFQVVALSAGTVVYGVAYSTGAAIQQRGSGVTVDTARFLILGLFQDGVNVSLELDGVNKGSWTDGGSETANASGVLASSGGGNYLTCDIGEIILYQRALPVSERLAALRYLGAKWGVAV